MAGLRRRKAGRVLIVGASLFAGLLLYGVEPELKLTFEGGPCAVTGPPGSLQDFVVIPSVLTLENPTGEHAAGWSLSLTTADGDFDIGAVITDIQVGNIILPTVNGPVPLTPEIVTFAAADLASDPQDLSRRGAIAAVALDIAISGNSIPLEGTIPLARVTVEAVVPPTFSDLPDCVPVQLVFEDGFQGAGERPVENVISVFPGTSNHPQLGSCSVPVCRPATAPECAIPTLQPGVPVSVTLTESESALPFKFLGQKGRSVVIDLEDLDSQDTNALYARWGDLAQPFLFDEASAEEGEPSPRLVVPSGQDETLYILVRAVVLHNGFNHARLVADFADLSLEGISSPFARRGSRISMTIVGSGFTSDTSFTLRRSGGGESISSTSTEIVSTDRAEVVFSLDDAPVGIYDLLARQPGGSLATLERAFEVVSTDLGALVTAELVGNQFYRMNRLDRLTLRYRNVGDEEVIALFKVKARGAQFRLDREEEELQDDEILVLATGLGGTPGKLPPGGGGEIPILFRPINPDLEKVQVFICTATERDLIAWDRLEPPEGIEDWESVWPPLSAILGPTWLAYRESLARIAVPLSHRGVYVASVRELFRSAVTDALGRPNSAILGKVVDLGSGVPLEDQTVLAIEDGTVKSSAQTFAGRFALPCLGGGVTYQIAVVDYKVGNLQVTLPQNGDVSILEDIPATPLPNGLSPASSCDDSGLPTRPLFPPDELFAEMDDHVLTVISSWDPNEKKGSSGGGDLDTNLIRVDDEIHYEIRFENKEEATAPAQTVVIEDILDSDLDVTTLKIRDIMIGGDDDEKLIPLDNLGSDLFSGLNEDSGTSGSSSNDFLLQEEELPVSIPVGQDNVLEFLDVEIRVSTSTVEDGRTKIRWQFTTLTSDALAGFLPPNDETQRGEGYVSLAIKPREGVAEGTEIENKAEITFDELAAIETNTDVQVISFFLPPGEPRLPVPESGTERAVDRDVQLSWQAEGATSYDLFLWIHGEDRPGTPSAPGLGVNAYRPGDLAFGSTYEWQVVAINSNGQTPGPVWDFKTVGVPGGAPGVPVNPRPPHEELNVSRAPRLQWGGGVGAVTFEVFLWPSVEPKPASPMVTGLSESNYQIAEELDPEEEYSWQVAALNGGGRTESQVWTFTTAPFVAPLFKRGDVNSDGGPDLSDSIFLLAFLFLGDEGPTCMKAGDMNGDGIQDVADAISLMAHLFLGDPPPPAPFPNCGSDPTPDGLDCQSYSPCGS